MCTAATYQTKDFYFGRNLDYEFPYGEEVCIVPRSFPIPLRHLPALQTHYAMIGMAHVEDGFPLFYDAVNETGLCIAGLNFVGNAAYAEPTDGKTNVAQFELIEWLLGTCRNLEQARRALAGCNLVGTPFSGKLPTAQLHWLIADETGAIVLESMADGLHLAGGAGSRSSQNGLRRGSGRSGSRSLGRFGLLVLRDGKFALDEDNNHQRDESHKNNRVAEQRNQSGSADLEVNHSLIYQKHTGHLSYASTIEYLQMFSSFALRSVRNFMV